MVLTHPKTFVPPRFTLGCKRKGLSDGGVLLAASASSRLVKDGKCKHGSSLTALQISRCHAGNLLSLQYLLNLADKLRVLI